MADPIQRLMRRIQHLAGVGRTTAPVNDAGAAQTVQLVDFSGNPSDGVKVLGIFGVLSNMPVGSDVAFFALQGDASKKVVIGTGHEASRPRDKAAGSSGLYDIAGSLILLGGDGTITLVPKGGILSVIGAIQATGDVVAGFGGAKPISQLTHKHPTAPSGPESEPIP